MATIKTRFCPSPTGRMHLGNTRTALFNALLAHHDNNTFLLRIEDTDRERSDEKYTALLMEDLKWLGIGWDEGPEAKGDRSPYWQSQRQEIYDQYYDTLLEKGAAYPCFCSEEQLKLQRKVDRASGKPPRYSGICARLTREGAAKKEAEGIKPTLRFRMPDNHNVVFHDLVKGEQRFNSSDIGDLVIRRGDGTAPFMFCNAIDDALMGVTHVLRGEDHLTNTPRQILILEALSLRVPQYGHISLIVGPDGSPLSKRHGSKSVEELREQGYFAEALVNYLARLGHYYSDDSFMSVKQLAEKFNIEALGSSPARFDSAQLLYWQKEAVAHADAERLWGWMGVEVPADKRALFIEAVQPNIVFPKDAQLWAKAFFGAELAFTDAQEKVLQQTGKAFFEAAVSAVKEYGQDFKAVSNAIKDKCGVKGKALFQPLRLALTAQEHGPEMAKVFDLLGVDTLISRLQR